MSLAPLSRRLPGKRAFITGAGSGLGLEFARALVAEEWAVGLFDVDPSTLAKAEEELSARSTRVHAFPGDVRDHDELTVAVNSFADIVGGLLAALDPDRIDTKARDMVEPGRDPGQIANAIAIAVIESPDAKLVYHSIFKPKGIVFSVRHNYMFDSCISNLNK